MIGAILVAAGSSARMGGIDKTLAPLGGRPLLAYSLEVIASHPAIERVAVVCSEANRQAVAELLAAIAPSALLVAGGARRRDSVRAGLDALGDCDYVLVHDAARPFVTRRLLDAALEGARDSGAALCAVPVSDTVKRATEDGLVRGTVQRQGLWLAQTPQAFRRDVLLQAHQASDIDATDDAALVELLEHPVRIVMGSSRNIKVTTPADLQLAEALAGLRT